MRPVLLIDEGQETATATLTELRLLSSAEFDSINLLTIVLCSDDRLPDRFRSRELTPLGTRVRNRLILRPYERKVLAAFLSHILEKAGAPQLMSDGLRRALVEHAAGNPRILCHMGAELLAQGVEHQLTTLDDDVFFTVFGRNLQRS